MSAISRKTALLLARTGALVLAIGTVSWFVWNAQVRAQPADTPAAGTPPPGAEIELTPEEMEELMLHSSKSFSPTDITIKQHPVPARDAPTAADPYLPSTKSLFAGGALPRPPAAATPSEAAPDQEGPAGNRGDEKKPVPKKPTTRKTGAWLPSSKSLPPQELPLPNKGK